MLLLPFSLLGAIGFAVIGAAAFADAAHRCPGIQCHDAKLSAAIGAGMAVFLAAVTLFALKIIKRG